VWWGFLFKMYKRKRKNSTPVMHYDEIGHNAQKPRPFFGTYFLKKFQKTIAISLKM